MTLARNIEYAISIAFVTSVIHLTFKHYLWSKLSKGSESKEPSAFTEADFDSSVDKEPEIVDLTDFLDIEKYDNQNVLRLLYLVAEDHAVRTGYVHRGVTCNTCGVSPVLGTRYHCTECSDVDICQACELAKRHDPMHLLVKIKIPIPVMVGPRWVRDSWRPTTSVLSELKFKSTLPEQFVNATACATSISIHQLDILHERFKFLADTDLSARKKPSSPCSVLPYALDTVTLQEILFPEQPLCLAAVRIGRLYDENCEGIVTFEDYVRIYSIFNEPNYRQLVLAFTAYDIHDTGFVTKKDAKQFLVSYYRNLCHSLEYRERDDKLVSRIEMGGLLSAKPLASIFISDMHIPVSHYPEKDSLLRDAPSVIDQVAKKFYENTNKCSSSSSHVPDDLQKVFGKQIIGDLYNHIDEIVENVVDNIWVRLFLDEVVRIDGLIDQLVTVKPDLQEEELRALITWQDSIRC